MDRMTTTTALKRTLGWTAGAVGLAGAGYAAYAGVAWLRYGRPAAPDPDDFDPLLDRFMPEYDVVERHSIRVAATAETTLAAAAAADLRQSPLVRAIFRAREVILRSTPGAAARPAGLLAETLSLGWRVLAEHTGREIVVGAVTQPWLSDVTFRGLSPDEFRDFREPDYVKIVWTLRADPAGPSGSIFRTETRVVATDASARRKFRRYWARFSPGIILIRRLLLRSLRVDAEQRMENVVR
jgi:hypothetical protein